jgi:hypothetical protein
VHVARAEALVPAVPRDPARFSLPLDHEDRASAESPQLARRGQAGGAGPDHRDVGAL